MKFTNGNWQIRKEFEMIHLIKIHQINRNDNAIELVIAPRDVHERYAQLDVPLFFHTFFFHQFLMFSALQLSILNG